MSAGNAAIKRAAVSGGVALVRRGAVLTLGRGVANGRQTVGDFCTAKCPSAAVARRIEAAFGRMREAGALEALDARTVLVIASHFAADADHVEALLIEVRRLGPRDANAWRAAIELADAKLVTAAKRTGRRWRPLEWGA